MGSIETFLEESNLTTDIEAEATKYAIAEGVANLLWNENFAYASGYDETKQKYLGLEVGKHITPVMSSSSLLVKPDVAQQQQQQQIEQERLAQATSSPVLSLTSNGSNNGNQTIVPPSQPTIRPAPDQEQSLTPTQKKKRRFYGSVELNSLRLIGDVQQIADEVVQHLTSLKNAKVKVTLEIEAEEEDGIPDSVIRTVSKNCRTLKFKSQEFEKE